MGQFNRLSGIAKGIRNLPDPSAPDTPPPVQEPDADDAGPALTCPQCGASLSLKAVAKPSAAPPPPMDAGGGGMPPATPDGGGPL